MRRTLAAFALILLLTAGGCVSTPPASSPSETGGRTAQAPASGSPAASSRSEEQRALFDAGRAAMDANHLSEGIRSFVAVLALAKEEGSAEAARLGSQAEAELIRIGNRLSLEPGEAWLSPAGSLVSGSARSVGKEGALQPAVYLFENWGSGKSPIPDAPIRFEFVRGAGVLTASAATDAFGRANANLTRLDPPGSEAVIRAYPAFTARGYTYAFRNVQRDFSYLPPSNVAKIVALERSPEGASQNPQVLDAVASILKGAGLATAPLDGKLLGSGFDKFFGGDPSSLRSLAGASGASYFAFVLSETSTARQMEYGGKKYNIFTSDCKTTLRMIRDDGTIVFALPLDVVRGQGGTPQAAVDDAFRKAGDALTTALNAKLADIRAALRD